MSLLKSSTNSTNNSSSTSSFFIINVFFPLSPSIEYVFVVGTTYVFIYCFLICYTLYLTQHSIIHICIHIYSVEKALFLFAMISTNINYTYKTAELIKQIEPLYHTKWTDTEYIDLPYFFECFHNHFSPYHFVVAFLFLFLPFKKESFLF